MGLEIERKFTVKNDNWKKLRTQGTSIKQGYLNSTKERTVRVRIAGEKGILTIKGMTQGITRKEFEYDIPLNEAKELMDLCERPLLEKTRFVLDIDSLQWEIDVFEGSNAGLVIAEVELKSEDQEIKLPDWIHEEVSHDPRYFNASLISNPFSEW